MLKRYFSATGLAIALFTVALLFSFPLLLKAQTDSTPAQDYRQRLEQIITEEKKEEETANGVDIYARYMPSRSVDAQSGTVEVVDTGAEYSYELKAFGKLPVEFMVSHEYIGLQNTTAVQLPAHLVGVSTGVEVTLPFFNLKNTYFRVGAYPSFYDDGWNFDSSSFRIPSHYFAIYQPNDKWTFILGVAVRPDFQDKVLPIAGFIYKPNDRLIFNILPIRPNITYMLNKKFSVFLEGDASGGEYEVAFDGQKNVILEYREFYAGSGIKYALNKYIKASVSLGGTFNRFLQYKESLGKVHIKDGLYTQLRTEIDW